MLVSASNATMYARSHTTTSLVVHAREANWCQTMARAVCHHYLFSGAAGNLPAAASNTAMGGFAPTVSAPHDQALELHYRGISLCSQF